MLDVIVVGAGPAGMTAAGTAARRGRAVALLERNARPGRKLMISGKGRCNLTNDCTLAQFMENVPNGGKFLFSAVSQFTPQDVMAFVEGLGVPLKVERGRRVFPVSDKAVDVVDALQNFAAQSGVRTVHGRAAQLLLENGAVGGVRLEDGSELRAHAVLVCTGGASYPLTGSTGDGYALARQAGHTVAEPRPSLVPLETLEDWPRDAQGLSLRNVTLTVLDTKTGKPVFEELGEMLFTHFGVTGPLVLSASARMAHMEPGRYRLCIDLKPALRPEQLDARLQRDLLQFGSRDFGNSLGGLLPAKLIPVFVRQSGIPAAEKSNQVTREQREAAVRLFKDMELMVKGFRPIEEAIVTSGGVSLREVNPKTMESKLTRGLYFAGEVLNADAFTGGFNLQIAFATGCAAGLAV